MKLALDLDGCLADFNTSYGKLLVHVTGRDLLPPGWATNPNYPSTWFWERIAGYTKEEESRVWQDHILKEGKFWRRLGLMPDAKEVLLLLNTLAKKGHDIYFLTHRMGKHAKLQTEQWLYDHGMSYPTVLLSGDKTPLLLGLDIEFFIDDKPETILEVQGRIFTIGRAGATPKLKHLYIKDAPYNRGVEGVKRATTVLAALKEIGL